MATENIPSRLHSVAQGNVVTGANEILDDDNGKKQNVINQENDQRLETLETAVGTGGSVDSRIESAKTEIVGGASSSCNTLGKAEALISTNANDIAVLQEAYAALTQNDVVVVAPAETWPVATPEQNTIYRVVDRVNTPPQYYTDYMWNGTAMVEMAQYNNAIDAVPTAGSHNLVESGGVQNELALGAVYDVSAKNPTAGPNSDGKWESLSALLSDANLNTLIPVTWRKGGMSIKFIHSSDNKYIQARCMAQNFTADITQWQVVDDEPIAGSKNLVESGGVFSVAERLDNKLIKLVPQAEQVGDIFYHTTLKKIYKVKHWPVGNLTDLEEIPYYKGAIYTLNNTLYVWNGSDLIPEYNGVLKSIGFIQPKSFSQSGYHFLAFDVTDLNKVFICVNGAVSGIYSIFMANEIPYSNPEYIVQNTSESYYEEIDTNDNKYIVIWIDNISNAEIKVGTNAIDYEVAELKKLISTQQSYLISEYNQSGNKFKYAQTGKNSTIILSLNNTGTGQYSIFLSNSVNPHSDIQYIKKLVTGDTIEVINTEDYEYVVVWVQNISDALLSITAEKMIDNTRLKFAALGDSITSNQVTNTALAIKNMLGVTYLQETIHDGSPADAGNVTTEFGNLAVGYATMTDLWIDGVNKTTPHLLKSQNLNGQLVASAYNTLSNQVLRLLQHTTPLNQQISWTHPLTGVTYSVDTSVGVGKGYTNDKPDIIYIAIGTNDTIPSKYVDDCETVFTQSYAELKRDTFASALRWAIETLRINYPYAMIFVATPLHRKAGTDGGYPYGGEIQKVKQILIKNICEYLGIFVIDSYAECGIGEDTVLGGWLTEGAVGAGGTHPNEIGRQISAKYIAGQIKSASGDLF